MEGRKERLVDDDMWIGKDLMSVRERPAAPKPYFPAIFFVA